MWVSTNKDYNSFELQKAVATHNLFKANQIVNYFGDNPKANPVLPIIAVLYAFFSKLLIVHQTGQQSDIVLASKLRVNPYFVKEYTLATRHYSLEKVIRNIHYLRDADLSIKGVLSVKVSERQVLKELVFKLMH